MSEENINENKENFNNETNTLIINKKDNETKKQFKKKQFRKNN